MVQIGHRAWQMTYQHGIDGIRQLQYDSGGEEPIHQHPQGQLIWARRGVAKIVTPRHIWLLAPGRAIWIPGRIQHGLQAIDNVVTQNIYFHPAFTQQHSTQCHGLHVTKLLNALLDAGLESTLPAERTGMIYGLLSNEFCRLAPAALCHITLPADRRLRQMCDILFRELNHGETLTWWGKKVGASERTLARLFREETQLSFSEWKQQLRLMEAVCNLARGCAVTKLAGEMGYASSSAFIAMFRKKLGVSPQRYLQTLR